MGQQTHESTWSGPGHPCGPLEGRRQNPPGAGLPSVALWPNCGPSPGPGQGPTCCHGRWEPSHTRQLAELSLEPLGPRRIQICRAFARRTAQNSRHKDMFTETGSLMRKGKISKTYREKISRTATHYNFPLPYLTRLLNKP